MATPDPRPRSRAVALLLVLLLLGAVAATAAGFAGNLAWPLDLCSHFRPHLAGFLLVFAVLAAALRLWRWSLVALLGVGVNAAMILPLYLLPANTPAAGGAPLRLLHLNVHTGNTRYDLVADEILTSGADVVFLQEVSNDWVHGLRDRVAADYRFVSHRTRSDNFGIAVLEKRGSDARITAHRYLTPDEAGTDLPSLEVTVRTADGRDVAILSTHPLPPVSGDYAAERNRQLAACGRWAARQTGPSVVIGDLNATPFSHAFAAVAEPAGLLNSQRGYGIQGTWPSGPLVLLMIPIDHCLHSPDLATVERRIGPDVGSDHRPLHVSLAPAG